ncbi:hypothetical protein [Pedobacter immunditicola]|uniref:hypothetical protein n=1 Tax=Pedobacter immunditicola TaxID=3133440 RepID=UPI0030A726A1
MKIKFKRSAKLVGTTQYETDILGRILANNLKDGIPQELYTSDVFDAAEQNIMLDKDVLNPLIIDEFEDVTIDTSPINTNGALVFAPHEKHYLYTFNYKPVSLAYECLFIYPDDVYILLEPETNRIIDYRKPKDAEVFLVK